jgi:hypothetical protein
LVIPGLPHHVTQRGNRRQQTFFCAEDYAACVEPNAVRAALVADGADWPWSSAGPHPSGRRSRAPPPETGPTSQTVQTAKSGACPRNPPTENDFDQ